MPNVIRELPSRQKIAVVGLGFHRGAVGSVKQEVSDGDTISSHPVGFDDLPFRFLGVDAPEKSLPLPGTRLPFISLANPKWEELLGDPFNEVKFGAFQPALTPALRAELAGRVNAAAAINHHQHALEAEEALVEEIKKDMEDLNQDEAAFRFRLAFANEVMESSGRLLGYINREQPADVTPGTPEHYAMRPNFYQERLLETGKVAPFFVWPNVDPFIRDQRTNRSLVAAVIQAGRANQLEGRAARLKAARDAVKQARKDKRGIFETGNPLTLQPFELRFLARRQLPRRWVIDLSKSDDVILQPQNYFTIPHLEDRMYIPEEYVPLFCEVGKWKRQP